MLTVLLLVLLSILNSSSQLFEELEDDEILKVSESTSDYMSKDFMSTREGLNVTFHMPGAISSNGYHYEVHEIVTEDGYILTAFRIPFGRIRGVPKRKPILFHHALFADSSEWMINHKENILAFQLADLGFDIWFANARGSVYSRKHKTLTDKDKRFFQFSMDEIGYYDVPAEIDYIIQTTGEPKILYIGHSMGGAVILIALSERPEYNEKICLITGFAPAVSVCQGSYIKPLLTLLGRPINSFGLDVITSGTGELPAPFFVPLSKKFVKTLCGIKGMLTVCWYIFEIAGGGSFMTWKETILTGINEFPGPSTKRILMHFVQFILTGKFEFYNHGRSGNMKMYGTAKTPVHNLRKVSAPVAIFGGRLDILIGSVDIARLAEALPNVILVHRIKQFNHFDFVTGRETNERLNKHVKELLLKF